MCWYRFSWKSILEVKVFLFAGPQPLTQWDQTLFSFFLRCLHKMKFKPFLNLPPSSCFDSHKIKLAVLITEPPVESCPIHTSCWLIAMVKLDFQHSQNTSLSGPLIVRSHRLQKKGQVWSTVTLATKPTWTHCAKQESSPWYPLL